MKKMKVQQLNKKQLLNNLTKLTSPDRLVFKRKHMARKRRIANVSSNVEVGDLIHYCPADLESEYHDFGIILDIERVNTHDRWYSKERHNDREFKVLWQGSNNIASYSSAYMNHSLLKKTIILYKS